MAVELRFAIRDGWRQVDNQRFGQCMEIRFVNTVDGKIMFRYAPNLRDEVFWKEAFDKLKVYDRLHKEIYRVVMGIDGDGTLSSGECSVGDSSVKKVYGSLGDGC